MICYESFGLFTSFVLACPSRLRFLMFLYWVLVLPLPLRRASTAVITFLYHAWGLALVEDHGRYGFNRSIDYQHHLMVSSQMNEYFVNCYKCSVICCCPQPNIDRCLQTVIRPRTEGCTPSAQYIIPEAVEATPSVALLLFW